MIQIIASDMDGTLLNDKMVISKRNADAIKEMGFTSLFPLVVDIMKSSL